uniref:Uncharacterized protein n=1 Tax=Lepeophtheirus salmonis TaxID=72036 RepID=A0A0K2UQC4_LEPSM
MLVKISKLWQIIIDFSETKQYVWGGPKPRQNHSILLW